MLQDWNIKVQSEQNKNEAFDLVFNKQYDAIKLLFENDSKIDIIKDEIETNENLDVWKRMLLLVKEN